MGELQAEISYWLSVAIRALQTFPAFIGNNWPGVLLSFSFFAAATHPRIKDHIAAVRALGFTSKLSYTGRTLMKTNWRTVGIIVGAFYLGNFLTVAFKDYSGISEQNKRSVERLTATQSQLSASAVNCQLQTSDIRNERDAERAKNGTLEKQNRDEQVLIGGCQSQALKLLAPAALKITPVVFDTNNENVALRSVRWLVLTNKPFTPVHINTFCGQGVTFMQSVELRILGDTSLIRQITPGARLAFNVWESSDPGTWSPEQPLLVTISYRGDENIACSFTPR